MRSLQNFKFTVTQSRLCNTFLVELQIHHYSKQALQCIPCGTSNSLLLKVSFIVHSLWNFKFTITQSRLRGKFLMELPIHYYSKQEKAQQFSSSIWLMLLARRKETTNHHSYFTCDSACSWLLYRAAQLEDHATGTMIQYHTQSWFLNTKQTSLFLLMWNVQLSSDQQTLF